MANSIKRLLLAGSLFLLCLGAKAQQWALQTNLVDYANFGTLNIEGAVAFDQHWSAMATAKLNPFLFKYKGEPVSARQQVLAAGVRWWPWHVYSGWWVGTDLRYSVYNGGGVLSRESEEGDAYGMGLYGGYSIMLNSLWNLDLGVGAWGGWKKYTRYSCPLCGVKQEQGEKAFWIPDARIAVQFIF